MRTKEVEIAGETCMLTMSNKVLSDMEAAGIKLTDLQAGSLGITDVFRLLASMIRAGARYAKKHLNRDYPVLSLDDLLEETGPEDYNMILETLSEVMAGKRAVDVLPPKNAEAPAAEAQEP